MVESRLVLSLQVLDQQHSRKPANHIRIDDAARSIASECDASDSPLSSMIWWCSQRSRVNTAMSVSSQPTDGRGALDTGNHFGPNYLPKVSHR